MGVYGPAAASAGERAAWKTGVEKFVAGVRASGERWRGIILAGDFNFDVGLVGKWLGGKGWAMGEWEEWEGGLGTGLELREGAAPKTFRRCEGGVGVSALDAVFGFRAWGRMSGVWPERKGGGGVWFDHALIHASFSVPAWGRFGEVKMVLEIDAKKLNAEVLKAVGDCDSGAMARWHGAVSSKAIYSSSAAKAKGANRALREALKGNRDPLYRAGGIWRLLREGRKPLPAEAPSSERMIAQIEENTAPRLPAGAVVPTAEDFWEGFPRASPDEAELSEMTAPVCVEEIREAAKLMNMETAALLDEGAAEAVAKVISRGFEGAGEGDDSTLEALRAEGGLKVRAVPLYKKGEATEASNYRYLAISGDAIKLAVKIAEGRVARYLESVLPAEQCGFRPGRSTMCVIGVATRLREADVRLLRVDPSEYWSTVVTQWDFRTAFPKADLRVLEGCGKMLGLEGVGCWRFVLRAHALSSYVLNGLETKGERFGLKEGCVSSPPKFLCYIYALCARLRYKVERADLDTVVGVELRCPNVLGRSEEAVLAAVCWPAASGDPNGLHMKGGKVFSRGVAFDQTAEGVEVAEVGETLVRWVVELLFADDWTTLEQVVLGGGEVESAYMKLLRGVLEEVGAAEHEGKRVRERVGRMTGRNLGVYWCADEDLNQRITRMTKAFHSAKRRVAGEKLKRGEKVMVIEALVRATAAYGVEATGLLDGRAKGKGLTLQRAEDDLVRRFLGFHPERMVSEGWAGADIDRHNRRVPLAVFLEVQRVRRLGHLARLPREDLRRMATFGCFLPAVKPLSGEVDDRTAHLVAIMMEEKLGPRKPGNWVYDGYRFLEERVGVPGHRIPDFLASRFLCKHALDEFVHGWLEEYYQKGSLRRYLVDGVFDEERRKRDAKQALKEVKTAKGWCGEKMKQAKLTINKWRAEQKCADKLWELVDKAEFARAKDKCEQWLVRKREALEKIVVEGAVKAEDIVVLEGAQWECLGLSTRKTERRTFGCLRCRFVLSTNVEGLQAHIHAHHCEDAFVTIGRYKISPLAQFGEVKRVKGWWSPPQGWEFRPAGHALSCDTKRECYGTRTVNYIAFPPRACERWEDGELVADGKYLACYKCMGRAGEASRLLWPEERWECGYADGDVLESWGDLKSFKMHVAKCGGKGKLFSKLC